MSATQLTDEIWTHVFGFLSVRDRLSVRLSCTGFRRLVDHCSLWRDSVIVLQRVEIYDSHFWRTLRQRKTKSIVVQKANAKALRHISSSLPWLSSLTLGQCGDGRALAELCALKHLEKLSIRQCCCRSLTSSLLSLRQLTHLSLCEVQKASVSEISAAISQLVNLTSLLYHDDKNPMFKPVLHGMLSRLPNLKHLSLRLGPKYGILPDDYFCPTKTSGPGGGPDAGIGLTSLELLNYRDPCLSSAALDALPSLTKLTVHYSQRFNNPEFCRLTKQLQGLHVLSELNIALGYPLGFYAKSIPRTVQRLSLMAVNADVKAVRMLAEQVPDLLHFHSDLCCHDISDIIKEMPQMFPKLQILKVRHQNIPASVFLHLQHLPRLQQLVLLDAPQGPSPIVQDLTQKLNDQTNKRIHVLHSRSKDQTTCSCGFN